MRALFHSAGWRSTFSVVLAFVAYGIWAFYINNQYGNTVAAKAGMVQGSYAFLLTLGLTMMLEILYRGLTISPGLRFPFLFISSCACLYSVAWGIHYLAGTPEILWTILPGALIGTVYIFSYLVLLVRTNKIAAW